MLNNYFNFFFFLNLLKSFLKTTLRLKKTIKKKKNIKQSN